MRGRVDFALDNCKNADMISREYFPRAQKFTDASVQKSKFPEHIKEKIYEFFRNHRHDRGISRAVF